MRNRVELGAFLRSRRAQLTPEAAGIDRFPGARRVPGLRRDELAVAAGVSPDYYSRLEQGRQANVSAAVLDALATVLRLDPAERLHLHALASPSRQEPADQVTPDASLVRAMDAMSAIPTLLLDRRGDVLGYGPLLPVVLGQSFPLGSSFVRWLFTDAARERITSWPTFAARSIGALRVELGRTPKDRPLRALAEQLRRDEPSVARWWEEMAVGPTGPLEKVIAHPVLGVLTFTIDALTTPQRTDQQLVVYSADAATLARLAAVPALESVS